ncbi:putative ribonuclease H-like domain-containing protein [Tanacetum coccineum]
MHLLSLMLTYPLIQICLTWKMLLILSQMIGRFKWSYDDDEDVGAVADFNNMDNTIAVSPIPTLRIHKDHLKGQILGDPTSAVQTRGKIQKASLAQQALQCKRNCSSSSYSRFGYLWIFRLKEVIGTNGFGRNKIDERSIVVKNKAKLVAQGHRQEEGIDYDEVFALVARIEAIRLFLAFASYKEFLSYQMMLKCVFFKKKCMFINLQALLILLIQTKSIRSYIQKIPDEFHGRAYILFGTLATTPIESNKPLINDEDGIEVDVHEYRSMIGSLMYLTASRSDIMFAVYACARFQVTPKASHLHAVKRIFRYLKHQPKLGLWYPRDSPFKLEAFSDSDYAVASLDMKSTTDGCQFLAAHCYGQVLWIQNQMMDYGFNFMNTKIHIDNESTICVVKNPVYHSRTKHIEIRHHFIRDCYEKRLIDVLKIYTDSNVADLLTKGFDVTSMDLRMDRSSPGKYNSSMVNSGSLQVNSGRLLVNSVDLRQAAVDQGEGSPQPAEISHYTLLIISSTFHQPPIPSPPHPSPPPHSLHQSPPLSPPHSPHQSPPLSPPHSPHQSPPFSPPRSYEAPLPEGNTSGSAEDSMQLKELMVLTPTLVTRVTSLKKELNETKLTLGDVMVKLVKKVKSLETALKRKSKKVIVSASESEEPEDQGRIILDIDDDPLGVNKEKSTDKGKRYSRRERLVAKNINIRLDAGEEINTGIKDVNTGSTKVDSGTASKRGQREGKAPMIEEDIQATHKKLMKQMRQGGCWMERGYKWQYFDKKNAKCVSSGVNQRKKHFAEERAKAKRNKKTNDSVIVSIGDKVVEVKEEEPVKRTKKRKKQKARKGVNVDKSAQEDSETDKEESVEAMIINSFDYKNLIGVELWSYGLKTSQERNLIELFRTMFDPPLIED